MKIATALGLLLLTSGVGLSIASTGGAAGQTHPQASGGASTEGDRKATQGERVFKENCSRCHDAPEALHPKVTRQVIRHMRVRASLSVEDEKALLAFMNRE